MGQLLVMLLAGLPIGFQLGLTGAGGALVGVPLLVYVGGLPVEEAAAISLLIVAASSLLGVWEYGRLGEVRVKPAVALSSTGIIGAWAGAYGHHLIGREMLLLLFGCLLLVAKTLTSRRAMTLAEGPAHEPVPCTGPFPRSCWLKAAGVGFAVGVLNGVFGVGGGFLVITVLILMLGFSGRPAIGTSLLTIALISLGGIAGHMQFGHLPWRFVPSVMGGSAIGMVVGARFSSLASVRVSRRLATGISVGIAVCLIVLNGAKVLGL